MLKKTDKYELIKLAEAGDEKGMENCTVAIFIDVFTSSDVIIYLTLGFIHWLISRALGNPSRRTATIFIWIWEERAAPRRGWRRKKTHEGKKEQKKKHLVSAQMYRAYQHTRVWLHCLFYIRDHYIETHKTYDTYKYPHIWAISHEIHFASGMQFLG